MSDDIGKLSKNPQIEEKELVMPALWNDQFGEIGAVLKILSDHGVTQETFELIRQDPKELGKMVAESITNLGIQNALKTKLVLPNTWKTASDLAMSCGFGNVEELQTLDFPRIDLQYSKKITGTTINVGIFKFEKFQFGNILPVAYIWEVRRRMTLAGYVPVPFKLFLDCVAFFRQSNSREMMMWKMRPLVCLDESIHADMGPFMCVINKRFQPNAPELEIGNIELTRNDSKPYACYYVGFDNFIPQF